MSTQGKQEYDKNFDSIKQSGQESFVAAASIEANDATMRMSLLNSAPQAVSTPFKDARPPLQNITTDLFENIKTGAQSDQSPETELQSRNSFQGNLTSSIFENIRESETRTIAPVQTLARKIRPFEFIDETMEVVEEAETVPTSVSGVSWTPLVQPESPISTSANEKLNHLITLMASAKKERTLLTSNVSFCSSVLSSTGRRPNALPMSDATYVLHRERTVPLDQNFSLIDSPKRARLQLLEDSIIETPVRGESRCSFNSTMNTKPIGALAFNEPIDFHDEEASRSDAKELDPEKITQEIEMATLISVKKNELFGEMFHLLERIINMVEKNKLLETEMKTTFQNLLSKRPL